MIVGLDIGASAVKLAGYENESVAFTHTQTCDEENICALIAEVLRENGIPDERVEALAVTGVGAERFVLTGRSCPVVLVPELEATCEGATSLAGIDTAVVVSVGTGTMLALAKNGAYTHVGGTGVGSGTLRGLAKKLSGITDLPSYFRLAEGGQLSKIDIQIRDLFSGTDTLPLDLTASNLAKCRDDGSEADWASALINMVLEVAGSHAALACEGFGVDTVIITGGLSQTEFAKWCYGKFDRLYKQTYIIPPHSGCATAIGAARRAARGA